MAAAPTTRHPVQRRWARQRPALLWADRLTRRVMDATAGAGAVPRSLARTLRETAVMAHAGTVAACRCPDAARAEAGIAAVDRALRRLGLWIGLAQRFGDLPPEAARPVLDAHARLRRALAVLAWEWRGGGPRLPREPDSPALGDVSLSVQRPGRARSPGRRT